MDLSFATIMVSSAKWLADISKYLSENPTVHRQWIQTSRYFHGFRWEMRLDLHVDEDLGDNEDMDEDNDLDEDEELGEDED